MSTGIAIDTAVVSERSSGLLLAVVPRYSSHGRPMRSCMILDPLGDQIVW
jgi:hypothetical protein